MATDERRALSFRRLLGGRSTFATDPMFDGSVKLMMRKKAIITVTTLYTYVAATCKAVMSLTVSSVM
jgi:hypothetical protein